MPQVAWVGQIHRPLQFPGPLVPVSFLTHPTALGSAVGSHCPTLQMGRLRPGEPAARGWGRAGVGTAGMPAHLGGRQPCVRRPPHASLTG